MLFYLVWIAVCGALCMIGEALVPDEGMPPTEEDG